jgi:hypothetical protein
MGIKTSDPVAVLIALLATAVLFLGFIVLVTVIDGAALMLLWNWFAVPLLGLPALAGLPAAIGIGFVADVLTSRRLPSKTQNASEVLSVLFARPLTLVLAGYIVHRFFL